jgi:hypothetical protein
VQSLPEGHPARRPEEVFGGGLRIEILGWVGAVFVGVGSKLRLKRSRFLRIGFKHSNADEDVVRGGLDDSVATRLLTFVTRRSDQVLGTLAFVRSSQANIRNRPLPEIIDHPCRLADRNVDDEGSGACEVHGSNNVRRSGVGGENAELLLQGGRLQQLSLSDLEDIFGVVLEVPEGRQRNSPQIGLRGTEKIHAVQNRLHRLLGRILILEFQLANARLDFALEGLVRLRQIERVGIRFGVCRTADNERREHGECESQHCVFSFVKSKLT